MVLTLHLIEKYLYGSYVIRFANVEGQSVEIERRSVSDKETEKLNLADPTFKENVMLVNPCVLGFDFRISARGPGWALFRGWDHTWASLVMSSHTYEYKFHSSLPLFC